jgi:hypothetical protein
MLIADLQYIESASEVEVNGGSSYCCPPPVYCKPKPVCKPICYKPSYNSASADAGAEAYGTNTKTYTSTGTKVIQGQYSGSGSSSFSEAF